MLPVEAANVKKKKKEKKKSGGEALTLLFDGRERLRKMYRKEFSSTLHNLLFVVFNREMLAEYLMCCY